MDIRDYGQKYIQQYERGEFETVLAGVRRQRVLQAIESFPHRTILEVGCGFEPLFPHVRQFEEYWIIEPMPEAVAAARAAGDGKRVRVVHGFLEERHGELPRELDFIAVSSLLHEVSDPRALLAAVLAHCGGQTVAHFNVPNVYSFHRLLAVEAGLISDIFEKSATEERFQRQTRFDRTALVEMMSENGFDVIEFGTYFVKPFTHSQMERMLENGIIDDRVIAGLNRMTRYLPDLGCEMYVNVRRR